MSMPQPDAEMDSLAGLEERVLRAVELVASLRAERNQALRERDFAMTELEAARAALAELPSAKQAAAQTEKLRDEIDALLAERKQVRARIEKLLGQIDRMSGQ